MLDYVVPPGEECLCCRRTTGCAGCYCEACDGYLDDDPKPADTADDEEEE